MSGSRHSLSGLIAIVVIGAAAMQGFTAWSRARLAAQVAANAGPDDIHMIASATCAYCAAARAWFDENHVPFSACEIEHDAACAAAYDALLAPGTPVMLVRGRRLVGFSVEAVADALARQPR